MKIIIFVTVLNIFMVSAQLDLQSLKPRNVYIKPRQSRVDNAKQLGNKTGPIIASYIVGGTNAQRNQFPWQVALVTNNKFFCGGSLLSEQWILTAAHCAESTNIFDVYIGGFNLRRKEVYRIMQRSTIKFIHPNYDSEKVTNDIALIKLPKNVKQNQFIRSIRLPKMSDDVDNTFEGSPSTVSGWGLTQYGRKSAELKYVNVHVISNEVCYETFDNIEDVMICTTGAGVKGTCNGDSGGSLVYRETDGKLTQIGIVSFGTESCTDSFPSAYARVSKFLDWISNITRITIRR